MRTPQAATAFLCRAKIGGLSGQLRAARGDDRAVNVAGGGERHDRRRETRRQACGQIRERFGPCRRDHRGAGQTAHRHGLLGKAGFDAHLVDQARIGREGCKIDGQGAVLSCDRGGKHARVDHVVG